VSSYAQWLTNNTVPKLFVNGEPGNLLIGAQREFRRSWPARTEVTVRGIHFLQEDSPDEIGQAIADGMGTLG
jgi:haloalkane dehalogenase